MYEIIHYSYCGMKIPRDLYATKEEAHAKMKSIARFYNKRFGCEITWRGPQNIEIHEPENCMIVPDFCGNTEMRKVK
jgi:hypothetical protein